MNEMINQSTGEVILADDTPEYWIDVISTEWRKSVKGVLNTAMYILSAKKKVNHGRFQEVLDGLPFGETTSQRLMAVGRDDWLLNPAHAQDLPNSWYTLYELTKLDGSEKDRMLSDGIISADMHRKDATNHIKKLAHDNMGDAEPMPDNKYQVIYADPPWDYGDKRDVTTGYSGAADHYPSMTIDELCELPVASIAGDNAVLFMWTTSPLLFECQPIIEAWGFKYKSSFIWDKVKHNVGHYNSVRHEILLVCTKGSCTPDEKRLFDSVVSIERSDKHSEKPEEFRDIIETLYHGNRIELFRRGTAPAGWTIWGNQADD